MIQSKNYKPVNLISEDIKNDINNVKLNVKRNFYLTY